MSCGCSKGNGDCGCADCVGVVGKNGIKAYPPVDLRNLNQNLARPVQMPIGNAAAQGPAYAFPYRPERQNEQGGGGGIVGGGGAQGGGGAVGALVCSPIFLNGYVAGNICVVGGLPQNVVQLPYGAGYIFGGGPMQPANPINPVNPGGGAGPITGSGFFGAPPDECQCDSDCKPPRGCCPAPRVIAGPTTESPKLGIMKVHGENKCRIYGKFSFEAAARLNCYCKDENNEDLKTKCPKLRLGYIQLCSGSWRASFANFANCSSNQFTMICDITGYRIDSSGYTVTKDLRGNNFYQKNGSNAELQLLGLSRTKRTTDIEPDCKGKQQYNYAPIGLMSDAPGINIDELRPPRAALNNRGGKPDDWLPFRVVADLRFRTYLVCKCANCKENSCHWYPLLRASWRMQINTTIDSFLRRCGETAADGGLAKGLVTMCKSERNSRTVDWNFSHRDNTVVTEPIEYFGDECMELEEPAAMADCDNPSNWCNPFVRDMANWTITG